MGIAWSLQDTENKPDDKKTLKPLAWDHKYVSTQVDGPGLAALQHAGG